MVNGSPNLTYPNYLNSEPGAILVGKACDFCRTWPHQEEVTVKGIHFILEDSPDEIGPSIAKFIPKTNVK